MRISRVAVAGTALVLLASGCGGGAKVSSKPTPTASPTATQTEEPGVSDEVLGDFEAAEEKYGTSFAAAEVGIRTARSASNLIAAQTAGRAARDALFNLDAAIRAITFPDGVTPVANKLLSTIAQAIGAFDEQNVTTDQAAFLAVDAKTGPAVLAVRADLRTLRVALGLPGDPPAAVTPTPTRAAAFVSAQEEVTRPYIQNGTITDAIAWRNDLLAIARKNVDAKNTFGATRSSSYGMVEAWVAAFPLLEQTRVVGSAVDAEPSGISGFTVILINSKENEGPKNPSALAFAAEDAKGTCAAGIIYGQEIPSTPKPLTLPAGSECTGNAAREEAIKAFGFSNPRG